MQSVPALPRWLGLAGLLPQFTCVAVLYAGPAEWREAALAIAFAYAALILSFLGGMWWGIAAAAPAAQRRKALGWLWIAAVLPSLVALACFLPWALDWAWPIMPSPRRARRPRRRSSMATCRCCFMRRAWRRPRGR